MGNSPRAISSPVARRAIVNQPVSTLDNEVQNKGIDMIFPHFTEYEAREARYPRKQMLEDVSALKETFPDWFELKAGFTFRWASSMSILLGPGTRAEHTLLAGRIKYKSGIQMMYKYKGLWCSRMLSPEDATNIEQI
jgi:hypothetical protein